MNVNNADTLAASRSSAEAGHTGQERVEPDGEEERDNGERDAEGDATRFSGTRRLRACLETGSSSFGVYRYRLESRTQVCRV